MTATATAGDALPMVLTEVEVEAAEDLSPSFVRLTLAGSGLEHVGVDGPLWDQRFKLIVPHEGGGITSVHDADESWLGTWMDRPEHERGHMRTYTIRALVGSRAARRLILDVVRHPGASGPGADWACSARVGDRAVALLPRAGHHFGGIEFTAPAGAELLLVGDESAVPAVHAILEQLPGDARGAAFLEVADAADRLPVRHPPGVSMTWIVRGEAPLGEGLHAAVLRHLGAGATPTVEVPEEVDPDLWETPTWSSSGESLDGGATTRGELWAWIAGESGVVTGLRRHLVKELGIDRRQVAFMGYWRRGVAMKS